MEGPGRAAALRSGYERATGRESVRPEDARHGSGR